MAVYVDDFRTSAQVGRGRPSVWSHMTADSREELHEFAAKLGLRRSWFQDPCVNGKYKPKPGSRHAENWHYDVTETVRQKAIAAGAVEVSWREFPAICAGRAERVAAAGSPTTDSGDRT